MRHLATLSLALALALPVSARADDTAERTAVATAIVNKTVIKTLDAGFSVTLEKTLAKMTPERAEKVRKEAKGEFDTQRASLVEGLSKQYAEKFNLDELKRIQGVYDDPVYQRFQALNADPKSEINIISQAAVTRLLNMLTLAANTDQPGGMPGQRPMVMPDK